MRAFIVGLIALALPAAGPRPLTTDTIWEWRSVGDPQISPDGNSVVYVLQWNDRMTDSSYSNLWIAPVPGNDSRPLTQGAYRDTSPRWSPDGKRLAYLSNRSGKTQIHVRWMDTGQEAQITDLQQAPGNIAWSPDGGAIAYTARVPGKPDWRVDMPEKPAGARWAEPPVVVTRLRWRFDGVGLIPPGYTHVFVVPSTGGDRKSVV